MRTFYEIERQYRGLQAIPDGWIEFTRLDGRRIPILLEIDRGREYQHQLKAHVKARLEFITDGKYEELFGTQAVRIAYLTTGERPEYRHTRLLALCRWTKELLTELEMEEWGSVFRFGAIDLDKLYSTALFDETVLVSAGRGRAGEIQQIYRLLVYYELLNICILQAELTGLDHAKRDLKNPPFQSMTAN